MIGDAMPHDPTYFMNTLKLDWRKEAKQLYDDLGVKIYSVQVSKLLYMITVFAVCLHVHVYSRRINNADILVQALNNSASNHFYRTLADLTSGYHLHLDQFSSIVQFIIAICFREQSVDQLQVTLYLQ